MFGRIHAPRTGKARAIWNSWRGIRERRDVYSKGRLHHWLRDVPVPTILAGSVLQKGFLCAIVVTKETKNTMKLAAMVRSSSSLFLLPLGTMGKETASWQRPIWTINQKHLASSSLLTHKCRKPVVSDDLIISQYTPCLWTLRSGQSKAFLHFPQIQIENSPPFSLFEPCLLCAQPGWPGGADKIRCAKPQQCTGFLPAFLRACNTVQCSQLQAFPSQDLVSHS